MKAIIVGDNWISSELMLSRCQPLTEAGYEIQRCDWLAADRNEMARRNLNIEKNGPGAEPALEGLAEAARDGDVLITHFCPVSREVVEAGDRLKAIGVARGGWENIAVEAATERGVAVVHIVGRNANAVAEHTVGLILCEMRNMARSHCALQSGRWINRQIDPLACFELAGKTLGLVGFGAIGQLVARRLAGFDVRTLVYDPLVPDTDVRAGGAEPASLEDVVRQSDIVSLHARLLPETEGLIGRRELALMKPTAYLVNTARAGLVDESALVEALRQRRIAGAALDVYWREPLPADDLLLALDNVTLTTHLGGTTLEALHKSIDLVICGVLEYLQHGDTAWVVNPGALAS
jgi:D-3-phosphoglycerate dehydrogenase